MGYFDAMTKGCFKTAQDGRRLFFPWGVLGRGYAIASEQDNLRLQQQFKIYMIVSLGLVIGAVSFDRYLVDAAIVALLVGFYLVWMRYLLRRLQPADERLTLRESVTAQAHAHSAAGLWLLEIAALAFVGSAILIFIIDPRNWLIALIGIFFFGLGAAKFAHMLVLRRRAAVTGSNRS
jgi:hypothetical protein